MTISIDDARLVEDLVTFLGRARCVPVERCGKTTVRAIARHGLDEGFVVQELRFHLTAWERLHAGTATTIEGGERDERRA